MATVARGRLEDAQAGLARTTGGAVPINRRLPRQCPMAAVRKNIAIYAGAFAIVGATPFLLLPILTKQLTPQQFGEVTAFLVLTALLANVSGLSVHGFVSVRFFKTPPDQFRGLVASSLCVLGASHLVSTCALMLLSPALAQPLGLSAGNMLLAAVTALFLNLNLIFLAIFQASGKAWRYFQARLLQGVVEFLLCILLIFWVAADSNSRIVSYSVAVAASAALGFVYCSRSQTIGSGFQRADARALLKFGIPMLPHILAGTAVMYVDRLIVSSILGVQQLGIYMVAMQIGMAMVALNEPLNKALAPWLFQQLAKNEPEIRRTIVKRTYQLFVVLAAIGLVIALAAHLLFNQLIGQQFSDARSLIAWMVAGFVLQGMYYTQVNYMFYAERTGVLSIVTGSTAVLGTGISYMLTTAHGVHGAAMSFFINNGILFCMVWVVAARAVPMPWRGAHG